MTREELYDKFSAPYRQSDILYLSAESSNDQTYLYELNFLVLDI